VVVWCAGVVGLWLVGLWLTVGALSRLWLVRACGVLFGAGRLSLACGRLSLVLVRGGGADRWRALSLWSGLVVVGLFGA
jgi:hypothetical protein